MDVSDGNFDVLGSESAFGAWVDAAVDYDLDDVGQHVGLVDFPFFVADLEFSPLEDDLDDLSFGFVGEELVEVCLFGEGAM